ncbi:MAG: 50S ribosomal protein L30 [Chrysiogenetes bacterium]|nr:50S ribosomal protein L30 [Chrysiogenetes bacterium]
MAGKTIRIRQTGSKAGCTQRQRESLRGLGLRRIRHEVEREDTPSIRGMVNKVFHLVEIVEESK